MGLSSLRYRFTGVMLAASVSFGVATVGISGVEAWRSLRDRTAETAAATLAAHAGALEEAVLVEDQLTQRELLAAMLRTQPRWTRVALHERTGDVVAAAAATGATPSTRGVTVHVPLLGGRLGYVEALVSTEGDLAAARAHAARLAVAVAALTVTGVLVALLLGRWLTEGLSRLTRLVDRIGAGELGETLDVPAGGDEVAALTRSVNRMSADLAVARQRLERQQRRMIEVEALATAGTLAAGIAHEVSNPLAGVQACVRRLARDDLPTVRRREYAAMARDGLDRATQVLRDLLGYARAGHLEGDDEPTEEPVSRFLQGAVDLVGAAVPVPVELIEGDDTTARWPATRVEQVLTNLLLNATAAARSQVVVSWTPRSDEVEIRVVDDGPGLPPEVLERAFEPFFTTRDPGQGTGLGLSVSRAVTRSLGGWLELRSSDRGAVAVLRLPRRCVGRRGRGA